MRYVQVEADFVLETLFAQQNYASLKLKYG